MNLSKLFEMQRQLDEHIERRSFFENQKDEGLQRMYDNWTKEWRLF